MQSCEPPKGHRTATLHFRHPAATSPPPSPPSFSFSPPSLSKLPLAEAQRPQQHSEGCRSSGCHGSDHRRRLHQPPSPSLPSSLSPFLSISLVCLSLAFRIERPNHTSLPPIWLSMPRITQFRPIWQTILHIVHPCNILCHVHEDLVDECSMTQYARRIIQFLVSFQLISPSWNKTPNLTRIF